MLVDCGLTSGLKWSISNLLLDLRDLGGVSLSERPGAHFTEHGQAVAEAFVSAYHELRARTKPPDGAKKSALPAALPIHVVRAQAAFTTATAREVAERALDALASGQLDLGEFECDRSRPASKRSLVRTHVHARRDARAHGLDHYELQPKGGSMSTIAATARHHMKDAWGLKSKPLPTEAIDEATTIPMPRRPSSKRTPRFIDKVVVAGLTPRRKMAFL